MLSISDSDSRVSLSFDKLVPSWLKHSLLTGLAVSKESVMRCLCELTMYLQRCFHQNHGRGCIYRKGNWIPGGERSEWHGSQVNHDPKLLLKCLSYFTISVTGKDERKQEINVKLLLLSKTLINAGTSVSEIYRPWILQVPEKISTTTQSVSLLYFWQRE